MWDFPFCFSNYYYTWYLSVKMEKSEYPIAQEWLSWAWVTSFLSPLERVLHSHGCCCRVRLAMKGPWLLTLGRVGRPAWVWNRETLTSYHGEVWGVHIRWKLWSEPNQAMRQISWQHLARRMGKSEWHRQKAWRWWAVLVLPRPGVHVRANCLGISHLLTGRLESNRGGGGSHSWHSPQSL